MNTSISGRKGTIGDTTVTTGGTAQFLFGGITPKSFSISNPDTAEDLWFSDSTTAAANDTGSYKIAAGGGLYETPVGYAAAGPVSVIGATTAHKITARHW